MRNSLFIVFALIILILGCDIDDFCISNPVTPNLVLRFYDANDIENTQEVDSLYVWALDNDTIHTNSITDSISLPLNTAATNTVYILAQGTQKQDTLTIEYNTEDEYVSRSCGFRVIFNDVVISEDDEVKWIQSFSPENIETINNQNEAHVKVYH